MVVATSGIICVLSFANSTSISIGDSLRPIASSPDAERREYEFENTSTDAYVVISVRQNDYDIRFYAKPNDTLDKRLESKADKDVVKSLSSKIDEVEEKTENILYEDSDAVISVFSTPSEYAYSSYDVKFYNEREYFVSIEHDIPMTSDATVVIRQGNTKVFTIGTFKKGEKTFSKKFTFSPDPSGAIGNRVGVYFLNDGTFTFKIWESNIIDKVNKSIGEEVERAKDKEELLKTDVNTVAHLTSKGTIYNKLAFESSGIASTGANWLVIYNCYIQKGHSYRFELTLSKPQSKDIDVYQRYANVDFPEKLYTIKAGDTNCYFYLDNAKESNHIRIRQDSNDECEYTIKAYTKEDVMSQEEVLRFVKPIGDGLAIRNIILEKHPHWLSFDADAATDISDNAYLDKKASEIVRGFIGSNKFVFVTDSHWVDSSKVSNHLIQYLRMKTGISKVLFGGDTISQKQSKPVAAAWAKKYMDESVSAFGDDMLVVMGNHDCNTQGSKETFLTHKESYDIHFSHLEGKVIYDEKQISKLKSLYSETHPDFADMLAIVKMHYYYDDEKTKTRYIILHTGEPSYDGAGSIMRSFLSWFICTQYDFMYDSLMSLQEGYNVIVAAHQIINGDNGQVNNVYGTIDYALQLSQLMSAFKTKTSVVVNSYIEYSDPEKFYSNGEHTYDFTNAPNCSKIFGICGDTHFDSSCITHTVNGVYKSESYSDSLTQSNDAILWINTQCENSTRYSRNVDGKGNAVVTPMTPNTTTETAFDVVMFDYYNVWCKRIGAGDDRRFNYK